eukprot:9475602-Pyramimonas_sp.AAC.1
MASQTVSLHPCPRRGHGDQGVRPCTKRMRTHPPLRDWRYWVWRWRHRHLQRSAACGVGAASVGASWRARWVRSRPRGLALATAATAPLAKPTAAPATATAAPPTAAPTAVESPRACVALVFQVASCST